MAGSGAGDAAPCIPDDGDVRMSGVAAEAKPGGTGNPAAGSPPGQAERDSWVARVLGVALQPPPPPPPDSGMFLNTLTQLAGQIANVAAGDKDVQRSLVEIAASANKAIGAGDFAGAEAAIGQLRSALAAAAQRGDAAGADGSAPARAKSAIQAATEAWQSASDAVDGQIAELQDFLRASPDPELQDIGETGLNALTAGHKVKLMAALRDLGGAAGEALPGLAAKTRKVVDEFIAYIDGDDRIAACDECPHVPMSIRATLGGGLRKMQDALASVAA